jgi:SPP1 gp7 family putative phage head morphogenesis protein
MTAKQSQILNYIFTSEMMALEMQMSKNGDTPIMDIYNAIWLAANLNIFNKDKYNSKMSMYMQNTTQTALKGIEYFTDTKALDYVTKQQLVSLINDNSMKYITKLGDDIKLELSKVLKDAVVKGEAANKTIANMQNVYKMNSARARTIVRTETMRAANGASYAQALSEGKKYYIVDSRAEACAVCKKQYLGKVFSVTDNTAFPPLHPNCACIPMYFYSSEDATKWSGIVQNDILEQLRILESKGLQINPNGTAPTKII